jgi:hypothetical protein
VEQLPDADVMPLIAYPEAPRRSVRARGLAGGPSAGGEAMAEVQEFAEEWLEDGGT